MAKHAAQVAPNSPIVARYTPGTGAHRATEVPMGIVTHTATATSAANVSRGNIHN